VVVRTGLSGLDRIIMSITSLEEMDMRGLSTPSPRRSAHPELEGEGSVIATALPTGGPVSGLRAWLDRPLRASSCFVGWCAATVVFGLIVTLLGGPSHGDYQFSAYSTWAIEHGQFGCAFPAGWTSVAPVYPLLSGGVAAIARIGNTVPYPNQAALGPHCGHFYPVVYHWWGRAHALDHTVAIGYVGWVVLLAGAVALLRACGRGRCGWEPATLVALACLPPVWMCVQTVMHPEDLVAMGFALGAMACARRDRWVWAGAFVALAILTQQFALLVATPLLVLAPGVRRIRFLVSTACTGLIVCVPLMVATSGQALHAVSQGAASVPGIGGTVLWEFHLHGRPLFVVSRVVPIALSLLISWWAVRRLGATAHDATALLSLVALSLSLRLVFEEAFFGYYFMALAVVLVLLDVVRGHVRDSLVAWVIALTLAYDFVPRTVAVFREPGLQRVGHEVLPLLALIGAICMIVRRVRQRERRADLLVWAAILACALVKWDVSFNPLRVTLRPWIWQTLLVAAGIALAAGPLLAPVWGRPQVAVGDIRAPRDRVEGRVGALD
jgi:hypothetical protein